MMNSEDKGTQDVAESSDQTVVLVYEDSELIARHGSRDGLTYIGGRAFHMSGNAMSYHEALAAVDDGSRSEPRVTDYPKQPTPKPRVEPTKESILDMKRRRKRLAKRK